MSVSVGAPTTLVRVCDVMTPDPVTVLPTDSLLSAWELMMRGDLHHLPVVVGGRCVSMLDDRAVATTLANPLARPRRRVSDVMPLRVHCITPELTLQQAAEIMFDERRTGLPVVDESMHLIGIVTDRDVLRSVAQGPV